MMYSQSRHHGARNQRQQVLQHSLKVQAVQSQVMLVVTVCMILMMKMMTSSLSVST